MLRYLVTAYKIIREDGHADNRQVEFGRILAMAPSAL